MTIKEQEEPTITLYDYDTDSVISETIDDSVERVENHDVDDGTADEVNPGAEVGDIFQILTKTDSLSRQIQKGQVQIREADPADPVGLEIISEDDSLLVVEVEGFDSNSRDSFLNLVKEENCLFHQNEESAAVLDHSDLDAVPVEEFKESQEDEERDLSNNVEVSEDVTEDTSSKTDDATIDDIDLKELDELEIDILDDENEEYLLARQEEANSTENRLRSIDAAVDRGDGLHSLEDEFRESIEEDISVQHSIVIEEKLTDVKKRFIQIWQNQKLPRITHIEGKEEESATPRYYSTQPRERLQKGPSFTQLPKPGLSASERKSIEEDIMADVSIVIEENVSDLHEHLKELWKNYSSQFTDISDQVIVFDDEQDVERFLDHFDSMQQKGDMKKLLSYFEKMFRELPENILTDFASSGYYDLFFKLLNQLEEQNSDETGK